MLTLGLLGGGVVGQATAQLRHDATQAMMGPQGQVTVLTVPSPQAQGGAGIDFVHAQPLQLPSVPSRSAEEARQDLIDALTSPPFLGVPGYEPGAPGSGTITLLRLGVPSPSAPLDANAQEATPEEFGASNHPFSTAQADLSAATNTLYPYRATGKLFFNIGTRTATCSASLIKRGIVVTAAHCVAQFGTNQLYTNWHFVPGYRNGSAPFGVWIVQAVAVLTAYLNGTDTCAQAGVICRDDVAVLLLSPQNNAYPGAATGWYGYGYNGTGFTGVGVTHITQLGYPGCLDNGFYMERNDSHGVISASLFQ